MRNGRNKILMIVLIVIAILAIAGGVFAYFFLATDVFKSGQELFAKYLMQNIEDIKEVTSIEKIEQLESKLEQSKYEENLVISCLVPEDTEPVVQITADTQRDAVSGKIYSILGLELEGAEEKMELEYMQENDMYSLRFTNAVKQFLTVQNSNLKQLAKNLDMDETDIEEIPDSIDFEKFSFEDRKFTEEEINVETNKYLTVLYNNIAKEKYQKNKDVVITVNGKTITTNSYVLTLSMQDIKALVIKVLETLKQDEIILGKLQKTDEKLAEYELDSIKDSFIESIQDAIDELNTEEIEEENIIITVYESEKETVRIKLEKELDSITLDTIKQDGKKQIDLNYTSVDEENTQFSSKVSLAKENDNSLNINFSSINGEEQQSASITITLVENGNNTEIDTLIEGEMFEITVSRSIEIVDEIEYDVTLDNSNNIILNNLSSTQLTNIFSALGARLNTEYVEPLETVTTPILMMFMLNGSVGDIEGPDFMDTETQAFNASFKIYEGENISAYEIHGLVDTVVTHNQRVALAEGEQYVTISGVITVEKDDTDVLVDIDENKNYNVECKMDENGYVNEIVITDAGTTGEIVWGPITHN